MAVETAVEVDMVVRAERVVRVEREVTAEVWAVRAGWMAAEAMTVAEMAAERDAAQTGGKLSIRSTAQSFDGSCSGTVDTSLHTG